MKPDYLHFNNNYVPRKMFYIVLDGKDIEQVLTKFWTARERKRNRIEHLKNKEIIKITRLKPRKQKFTPENTWTDEYKIVEVGTKDRTTHLPEGKIYQIFPCD